MRSANKRSPIYAPYQDGQRLLCSRCFNPLGSIEKYGHDSRGYWFIAPCRTCAAKMKWYRKEDGTTELPTTEQEDGAFRLTLIDGELTLTYE